MVRTTDENNSAECIVQNKLPNAKLKKITLKVRPSYTVDKLFSDIRRQLEITDNFILILEREGKTNFEVQSFLLFLYINLLNEIIKYVIN